MTKRFSFSDDGRDMELKFTPPNPPNEGILFVDNAKHQRSGHVGHALVEYEPGKILAFFANCSNERRGHAGGGWMEYRRSMDGGRTWEETRVLDYSKQTYLSQCGRSVMTEKAVGTDQGTVVLLNLECDITENPFWEPFLTPTVLRSTDGGRSWGETHPFSDEPGRIYDALWHKGAVLVLEFCNDARKAFVGTEPEHLYKLFASTDDGKSFSVRSVLPFNTFHRSYGAMEVLPDGGLIAYIYNSDDEKHLDYTISYDDGVTWGPVQSAYFAKQIRNPQMSAFKDGYVLHGRSGSKGEEGIKGHFVLYNSPDGVHWDEGRYMKMREAGVGAYSNNLRVHDPQTGRVERLLIQASHAYFESNVNVYHWWLE